VSDATLNNEQETQAVDQTQEAETQAADSSQETEVLVPPDPGDTGLGAAIKERVLSWIRGNPRMVSAPASAPAALPETVGQMAISADTPVAEIVAMLADATGDTEDVIRGIEDDKEHPVGQVVVQLLIVLGYVAPPVLSALIGVAIGLQYSGGLTSVLGIAIFVVCIFYELGLVWLMFAIVRLARRVMATRHGIFGLLGLSLFYLFVAIGSSLAQWAIYESRIDLTQGPQIAGAVIRTFATPLVDTICAVSLPILLHVSLDKRLAEIERKAEATIAINKKKIAARLALIQEAILTKSTLQKEKDYQAKNDMANQLIDMISQKILSDTRRSLDADNQRTGYGTRRDSYR
jgi:hypothetical protein